MKIADKLIAQSTNAYIIKEVGTSVYNPVFYFPKEGVKMDLLELENGRTTHCPIKGDASYWNLKEKSMQPYFA